VSARHPDGVEVTTDLARIDLGLVHHWLSTDAHWALGRTRATVETAAAHSLNFGVVDAQGRLHGYARVVTDHTTFAWLCDVYVGPSSRGRGLGTLLVDRVLEVLAPLHVKRTLLVTMTAPELYARAGFAPLVPPGTWMMLTDPTTA
jgi:GNAT superfamily N-acetyltransferase